ncbi:MAG: ECF transporter S component [Firmicutes bacterium]|nr:ECF transporter S component [Bacillota bacterium]
MKNITTRDLCIKALLIALVCVATMVITVPVPATSGYIHLGDSIILISSIFFGWEYGLIAGGVGSAMADLLGGYAHWVPFTFVIKALMGFVIGKIANYDGSKGNFFSVRNMLAAVAGIVWMIFGYLIGGTILKGSFAVALTSVPSNAVQGVGGLVIYIVIGYALDKAKIYRFLHVK